MNVMSKDELWRCYQNLQKGPSRKNKGDEFTQGIAYCIATLFLLGSDGPELLISESGLKWDDLIAAKVDQYDLAILENYREFFDL
jgi:hypothetical protein